MSLDISDSGWAGEIELACSITDVLQRKKFISDISRRIKESKQVARKEGKTNTMINVVSDIYKGKKNTFKKDLAKCKLFTNTEIKSSVPAIEYLKVLLNLIETLEPDEYKRFIVETDSRIEFDSLPYL